MFFSSPLHELFDKFMNWAKTKGGWVYWSWVVTIGVFSNVAFDFWMNDIEVWRTIAIAVVAFWMIGAFIGITHDKRKLEREAKKNVH